MRLFRLAIAARTLLITLAVLMAIPVIGVAEDSLFDHPKLETGSAGLTLGTPGVFNINITKITSPKWGYTFAAGYISGPDGEHWTGLQVGAVRLVGQSKRHYAGATIIGGYMDIEDCCDQVSAGFVGVGGLIKWHFLYGEVEMMFGSWQEEWGNPQLGLQLGFAILTFH